MALATRPRTTVPVLRSSTRAVDTWLILYPGTNVGLLPNTFAWIPAA